MNTTQSSPDPSIQELTSKIYGFDSDESVLGWFVDGAINNGQMEESITSFFIDSDTLNVLVDSKENAEWLVECLRSDNIRSRAIFLQVTINMKQRRGE